MKYTEKELIRLKTLKETAKKEYRVFISSREASLGSHKHVRKVLKDKKRLSKRTYYSYKKKYKKMLKNALKTKNNPKIKTIKKIST